MALILFRNFISIFSNLERFESFNVSGLAGANRTLTYEGPVLLVAELEVRILTLISSDLSFQSVLLCRQFPLITINACFPYSYQLQCLLFQLAHPCPPRQQETFFISGPDLGAWPDCWVTGWHYHHLS